MSELLETLQILDGTGRESLIYSNRFSSAEDATRKATWKILVNDFFSRYIHPYDTVIDLGAGDGNFIKHVKANRRIAIDLSPHVRELEKDGIEVHQVPAHQIDTVNDKKADVVFMSNFLEHLTDKRSLLLVLEACHRALRQGGRVIVLQPNIKYVGHAYWDYIDHHIAITEHSLSEALQITGFEIESLIPRFLPYTAKSNIGSCIAGGNRAWLVKLYLRLPIVWRFLGQQTLVVARAK